MNKNFLILIVLAVLSATAEAALVVTTDDSHGHQTQQYFEKGSFVLVDGGQPTFGIDAEGNCWFVSQGQRVFGKCEDMFASMDKMRQEMMAGMSPNDRAMMEKMMQGRMGMQAPKVVSAGTKQIAGYANDCYKIGGSHEICVSKQLMGEIKSEMGNSYFMDLQTKFARSGGPMGMRNLEKNPVVELSKKGFPMEDRQRLGALPGMNPEMMQHIPKAQREQIMQRMAAAGVGQEMSRQVTQVDKNGAMPKLDLSRYPTVSFDEFMQKMMGNFPPRQ